MTARHVRSWVQHARAAHKRLVPSLFGLYATVAVVVGAAAPAAESNATAAFVQLSSLAGKWEAVGDDQDISVTYTLIAGGSTLVEDDQLGQRANMMTMFSVDGDHLIAVHYCSAGNQPQMATKTITDPQSKSMAFSLVRVTGLRAADDWHNTGLELLLEDKDHLTQTWTYRSGGKAGTRIVHLVREAP
jgi:hypothetical protein